MYMIYYIIYKVTNKVNGKIYIGSHKTKNLDDGYMGSGKYLKHAIRKYGLENFDKEILHVYDTPDLMYAKEAEIVNENFLSTENTYNLKVGGLGGFDYINILGKNIYGKNGQLGFGKENLKKGWLRSPSDKEKEQISKTLKEAYKDNKIFPKFKGKKHSEETKKIIGSKSSVNQLGERNSQFNTQWITNGLLNKKLKKDLPIPYGWIKGRTNLKK